MMPLLDLSILLLGLFVILLSFAKFDDAKVEKQKKSETEIIQQFVERSVSGKFNLFCVFAACEGDTGYEKGKFYRLTSDFKRGDLIRSDEIKDYVGKNSPQRTVIGIITSKGAWDKDWDSQKLDGLKKEWGTTGFDVVRIRNIEFND